MDYELTENRWSGPIALDHQQIVELETLGRLFASSIGEPTEQPTAVALRRADMDRWNVRVDNAIGLLVAGGDRFVVKPKIPMTHLVYLLIRAGRLPRSASASAASASATYFWELVAEWYISELEALLRHGLRSGYTERTDELTTARGRVLPVQTTVQILRGRCRISCRHEEFGEDTPINRVLLAAARSVSTSPLLPRQLRLRARRAQARMGWIGDMRVEDLRSQPDRSERRYALGFGLAAHVIQSRGRSTSFGTVSSRAFLVRTPEPVEEALRAICRESLAKVVDVHKSSIALRGAAESLNPDLVFGEVAVGDVKYKVWDGVWPRNDLYQLVTFATGFGTAEAVRVGFADTIDLSSSTVHVGPIRLRRCDWAIDADIPPQVSEERFRSRLNEWFVDARISWSALSSDVRAVHAGVVDSATLEALRA